MKNGRPPRDNLYRAIHPGVELHAADNDGPPTMVGHFAVFNQWTEINSIFEGHFLERNAPGAFAKTIKENRESMRVLFQHGRDPAVGDKPLGAIGDLQEDATGARYEVPLLDAPYVREQVLPGLEAGLYGTSHRFRVMREEIVEKPKRSAHNPDGIPERTIKEAHVMEFGPVTFPAYKGASAGVRSLTDAFTLDRFLRDPSRLQELIEFLEEREFVRPERDDSEEKNDAPPKDSAEAEPHPAPGRRAKRVPLYGTENKTPSWRL